MAGNKGEAEPERKETRSKVDEDRKHEYPFYLDLFNAVVSVWPLSDTFSLSCRAASMDIPDPLSPFLPIVHRFWQVFRGYIPYPHRAAVCMFELAIQLLLGCMWGFIGVHHL